MRWWMSVVVSLAVIAGVRPGVAWAGPTPPARDLGGEVLSVFANKCASCHGPDLSNPKGRFGYVLDLRKVAANPELVIPGEPTQSELLVLVQKDEMPPRGALAPEQKEVIREWIAAGAPDAAPVVSADRILRLLGKFHLLLLHFPIALVVAAGLCEAWSVWRRSPRPSETVRFCLWLAALTAIPTAGLGWLYAADGSGLGSSQLLTAHRWLGTTAAVWLVITAVCVERDARRGLRSRAAWLLMTSAILVTALTAHLGGLLDRGSDFFNY